MCRSWRSWWTTTTAAIYFRSSPSQFRIAPLCSWKSFRGITTRWGHHWQPLQEEIYFTAHYSRGQYDNGCGVKRIWRQITNLNAWFTHRASVQETSSLFLKPSKQTSTLEEIWLPWHQMEFQRTCDASILFYRSSNAVRYKIRIHNTFIKCSYFLFFCALHVLLHLFYNYLLKNFIINHPPQCSWKINLWVCVSYREENIPT